MDGIKLQRLARAPADQGRYLQKAPVQLRFAAAVAGGLLGKDHQMLSLCHVFQTFAEGADDPVVVIDRHAGTLPRMGGSSSAIR